MCCLSNTAAHLFLCTFVRPCLKGGVLGIGYFHVPCTRRKFLTRTSPRMPIATIGGQQEKKSALPPRVSYYPRKFSNRALSRMLNQRLSVLIIKGCKKVILRVRREKGRENQIKKKPTGCWSALFLVNKGRQATVLIQKQKLINIQEELRKN